MYNRSMAGKPARKLSKATRDQIVQVRTTKEQKDAFMEAAERDQLTLSAWIVRTCWRAAKSEREKAEKAARAPE